MSKKELKQAVADLGGTATYSGKMRTMFITVPHGKGAAVKRIAKPFDGNIDVTILSKPQKQN